jgi:hypothetical protein
MSEEWSQVTPEQMALLRSCGPDERIYVYGTEWVKVTTERLLQMMEQAFKAAYTDAAKELGEDVETFDVDEMDIGQTYMRVRLTGKSGKQCAGVGPIPDPRAH